MRSLLFNELRLTFSVVSTWSEKQFKAKLKRENHFVHNNKHTNVLSRIDAITKEIVKTELSDNIM